MRQVDLQLYLSGATSNGGVQTDPNLAFGNFRSSSRVKQYAAFTTPTNVTGVTIKVPGSGPAFDIGASVGNGNGNGTLDFIWNSGTGQTLSWTPPGGSIGGLVDVDAGGDFVLYGADTSQFLFVTVAEPSLPNANATDSDITISRHADIALNLFDNVTSTEAAAGSIKYRAIFLKNEHASEALNTAKWYIKTITPSTDDSWAFAVEDPSSRTTGFIQTIADEDTAPTGLSWNTVTTEGTAIEIANDSTNNSNLLAGESTAIWFRRIVTAGASAFGNNGPRIAIFGDVDTLEN